MTDQPHRRPTLKELARAAGVSMTSASYAINGTGSLAGTTRAHILEVAAALGYRANLNARATRTGRSGAVGLVLPDLHNQLFPTLAQAVIQECRRRDLQVFIAISEGSDAVEREAILKLSERGVDGLLWFPIGDVNTAGAVVETLPTIVLDRTIAGLESVQADCGEGGRLAAEHLLAMGHRRIGIISGPMDILSMRQRCEAATALIEARGMLAFRVANSFTSDLEPAARDALASRAATALFVGADVIALGVLREAETLGLAVPDDLSVVSFDDIPWSRFMRPALTTIELPLQRMAAAAVDALVRRFAPPAGVRPSTVLDVRLIRRDTVRRIG